MNEESRLVDLQNKLGEIGAKLDALVKATLKDADIKAIKYPKKEVATGEASHPYQYLLDKESPVSTIDVPVVLAEGKKPSDIEEPEEEVDMATIPAPVTPTPEPAPASPNPVPPPPPNPPSGSSSSSTSASA